MTLTTNLTTGELVKYCADSHDAFVRKAGERLVEAVAELGAATTRVDRLEWENKGVAEWRDVALRANRLMMDEQRCRMDAQGERDEALARAEWMLHNAGLLNEWAAKEWRPNKHPPLIEWLRQRIDAALAAQEGK